MNSFCFSYITYVAVNKMHPANFPSKLPYLYNQFFLSIAILYQISVNEKMIVPFSFKKCREIEENHDFEFRFLVALERNCIGNS